MFRHFPCITLEIKDFLTILLMDEIDILSLEVTEEAIQEFFSERLAK